MTPALLLLKDLKDAVIHFEDVITKNNLKWKWMPTIKTSRQWEA